MPRDMFGPREMAHSAPRACARHVRTTPIRRDISRCAHAHDFPTHLFRYSYLYEIIAIIWLMSQPFSVVRRNDVPKRKMASVVRNAQHPRAPPSEVTNPQLPSQIFAEFGELQATDSQVPLRPLDGPRPPSKSGPLARSTRCCDCT